MSEYNEPDASQTRQHPAWGPHNPVPTVQKYRASKKQLNESLEADNEDVGDEDNDSNDQGEDDQDVQQEDMADTSEVPGASRDPKQRRKEMHRRSPNTSRRTVTDPVTHLPVEIRDYTDNDMKEAEHGKEEKKPLSTSAAKVKEEATMPEILIQDGDKTRPLTAAERNRIAVARLGKEFGKGRNIGLSSTSRAGPTGSYVGDSSNLNLAPNEVKRLGMFINTLQDQAHHDDVEESLPKPDFEAAKTELAGLFMFALMCGVVVIFFNSIAAFIIWNIFFSGPDQTKPVARRSLEIIILVIGVMLMTLYLLTGMKKWFQRQSEYVWQDEVDLAEKRHRRKSKEAKQPETTTWLNLLIGSIWPLINPDLFNSVADTLEDVMQASLPKLVRMVSIEDLGQGSEPLRIMGIRWLPKGQAAKSISDKDTLGSDSKKENDNGQNEKSSSKDEPENQSTQEKSTSTKANSKDQNNSQSAQSEEGQDSTSRDGMDGEEGEFVNVELAFAYRAQARNKELNIKKRNAHLYLAFYLPGHIKLPVWVELRGLVGTMRARLQLTPDPPFVALCTITFLGQPKVDMSCVPLTKRGLNIMDVPLISNFVQSAVDAAMAQYVAPKSLTLDLKAMLAGDDFKRDTDARGVLVVRINRAFDFKQGDVGIPLLKEGSSDPYVSVGWAKLGKPIWSTRVLINNMEPYWEEEGYLVFGPEELDAEEKLRVQLWDSDRTTADDDLGRVEIELSELMKSENTNGKMWKRTDTFQAMKAGEKMPGRFDWSVGFFPKLRLQDSQVKEQSGDSEINTVQDLHDKTNAEAKRKLREVAKDVSAELEQQKEQDFENAQIEMISNSVPFEEYPSGVLSIQIHQIVGLQIEEQNKTRATEGGDPDTQEAEDFNLPDSYCNVILDHQKIFKTRTKPKSSSPFFNACIERFVRDWRTTIIHVSVRDSRIHENDPLIGVVYLPLAHIFRDRKTSHFNEFFPLAGGIGYGRARISVVFRSVELQAPAPTLGWDTFGTLEVFPKVEVGDGGLPEEYRKHKLKMRTTLSKTNMQYDSKQSGLWQGRDEEPLVLAVRRRHSSNVIFELSGPSSFFGGASAPAYAVLWLQDIPDEEEQNIDIPVYKGNMERAEFNKLPETEMGEKIGSLRITVWFSRGLSKAHRRIASKNQNISDVMEVLDCTENTAFNMAEWNDEEDQSEGEDNEDKEHRDEAADEDKENKPEKNVGNPGGIVEEIKDYKKQKTQLHGKNRGLMQWKGPRTLKWMKGKGGDVLNKVGSRFEHQEREPDVQTEA